MEIIVLQHIKVEDPGYIKDLMLKDGVNLTTIELDEDEKIPQWIVVSWEDTNNEDPILTLTVSTQVGTGEPDPDCDDPGAEGWKVKGALSLSVAISCEFGPIDSVTVYTAGIDETQKSQNNIQGSDDKLEIFKAKSKISQGTNPLS